jgi:hypothetical protein
VKTFSKIILAIVALASIRLASGAEPQKTAAAPVVPAHSTFVVPTNIHEGRDPFFPESTRPYEAAVAANKTVEITTLAVKGISGPPGHRLVIINNHTFGVGDEGDVLTSSGRVHIRCTEVRADGVTIEINGQRHELHLGAQ